MRIDIITPEKNILSEETDSVILPSYDGELGVLAGHIPFIALLKKGRIKTTRKDALRIFNINGGYAEIRSDRILVLTEEIGDVSIYWK